jgi:predicted RNase H-like HicB family nuclease
VKHYHINLFHNEEGDHFVADIPDLEGCSAVGKTPAEALAEVEKAREAWLETAKRAGHPIPLPRYRPAIYLAAK